jgi:UDP-N-acetyl-2-amino-2-deoxyglucuronate dehydrogenase
MEKIQTNSNTKPIRVGVIGVKGIGELHLSELEILSKLGETEIIAVSDVIAKSAEEAAERFDCACYFDFRSLLTREDIDLVHICVPSGLHGDIAIAAARAGKHVIVEKPMDISVKKAEQMIQTAREHGTILSVVKQNRFADDIQRVRSAMKGGLLGKPILANASVNWFRSQSYYDSSQWRGTWAVDGGGAVMNQGIHTVDLLLYLMGDYETLGSDCGTLGHERIEVEDTATAAVRFKSGALGVFTSTTCAYPGFSVRLEIFGNEGSVIITDNKVTFWRNKNKLELPNIAEKEAELRYEALGLHGRQFLDVAKAIRNNKQPHVTGEEGIRSLHFIEQLYELNANKTAVKS